MLTIFSSLINHNQDNRSFEAGSIESDVEIDDRDENEMAERERRR